MKFQHITMFISSKLILLLPLVVAVCSQLGASLGHNESQPTGTLPGLGQQNDLTCLYSLQRVRPPSGSIILFILPNTQAVGSRYDVSRSPPSRLFGCFEGAASHSLVPEPPEADLAFSGNYYCFTVPRHIEVRMVADSVLSHSIPYD